MGAGDADLFGGGVHGHAQGVRRAVWLGTGQVEMRAAERACIRLRQRATQPAQTPFLGWERPVGVRQASGEGTLPLAGSSGRGDEGGSQPGRTDAAAGGHRFGADQAPAMVSDSKSRRRDIDISYPHKSLVSYRTSGYIITYLT